MNAICKPRTHAKKGNPNRKRSKNNPAGKRNDPTRDWAEYARRRKAEGENYDDIMQGIADKARELMGIAPGTNDTCVSAILLSIVKVEHQFSYWDLVSHLKKHPEDLTRCELYRQYSRSWYQLQISEVDPRCITEDPSMAKQERCQEYGNNRL